MSFNIIFDQFNAFDILLSPIDFHYDLFIFPSNGKFVHSLQSNLLEIMLFVFRVCVCVRACVWSSLNCRMEMLIKIESNFLSCSLHFFFVVFCFVFLPFLPFLLLFLTFDQIVSRL